jgi:hypothetical protein
MRKEHDSLVDKNRVYRRAMRTRMIPVLLSFVVFACSIGLADFLGAQTPLGTAIADVGLLGWLILMFGGMFYASRRERAASQYKLSGEENVFIHTYRALDFLERYTKRGLPEWKKQLKRELSLISDGINGWTAGDLAISKDINMALDNLHEGYQRSVLPVPDKGSTDQLAAVQDWLGKLVEYLLGPAPQGLANLNNSLAKLTPWPPSEITTRRKVEDWMVKRTWVRYPVGVILGIITATIIFEVATVQLSVPPSGALTPAVAGFVGVMGVIIAGPWPSRH